MAQKNKRVVKVGKGGVAVFKDDFIDSLSKSVTKAKKPSAALKKGLAKLKFKPIKLA